MSTALAIGHTMARLGGYRFSPAALFEGGTVSGAWYDPSDLSTMFTTSAGTTPVAMPGQGAAVPVGLMLDKSQQSGFVTVNGVTWQRTAGDGVLSVNGNQITVTGATTTTHITRISGDIPYVLGLATMTVRADYSAATGVAFWLRGSPVFGLTSGVPQKHIVSLNNSPLERLDVGTGTVTFTILAFEYAAGNHAISFNNTTARPELRARVNLLTYSEEFDNGAWTKTDATAANTSATTDPLGGTTAESLTENSATAIHRAFQEAALATANVTVTVGISLKANTRTKAVFGVGDNSDFRFYAAIDLSAGTITQSGVAVAAAGASLVSASIFSQGNGWYRVTLTGTVATGQTKYFVNVAISNSDTPGGLPSYLGDGTSGIYIWGADLRPANIGANVPAYQRIADANTYDTNGFPLYLRFDGVDDSMYTPASINFSGTDKMSVFAGVRKLSDAALGMIYEFSTSGLNAGAFDWFNNSGTYRWGTNGTGLAQVDYNAGAAPLTSVMSVAMDNAQASVALNAIKPRFNGAAVAAVNAGPGSPGNYGTYPLYIGARNNSGLWFNGHLHSLIIAGSAVSAGNISATEQWVAQKTGLALP